MKYFKTIIAISLGMVITFVTPVHAQAPLLNKNVLQAWQEPRAFAKTLVVKQGWSMSEFQCLSRLWGKESAWNHKSDNPHSTAYGIAQMLNEKSTSPVVQISNGIRYIKHRYDKPCSAWKFWQRHYWY